MSRIIDVHTHVSMRPLRDLHVTHATPAVLKQQAQAAEVERAVILATRFPYKGSGTSARAIAHATGGDPFFRMFGTLDAPAPITSAVLQTLDEEIASGIIVGLKLYPGYQPFDVSDRRLDPVYALARAYHIPVMLHGGNLHRCCSQRDVDRKDGLFPCGHCECPLIRDADLARPSRLAGAAARFPDLTFIVAHLGNPFFQELRDLMHTYPNIMTDTSGQVRSGGRKAQDPTYLQHVVDELDQTLQVPNGPERVLFGSDFPIQSYDDSLWFVEHIDAPPTTKELILYGNAAHLLNL